MIPILLRLVKVQRAATRLLHIGYLIRSLDAGVDTHALAADSDRRNHLEGGNRIAIVDGFPHHTVARVGMQWLSCALPGDEGHAR